MIRICFFFQHHQQKLLHDEKRRQKHSSPLPSSRKGSANQHAEFTRFGNYGVVAKETPASPAKTSQSKSISSSGASPSPTAHSPRGDLAPPPKSSVCILT